MADSEVTFDARIGTENLQKDAKSLKNTLKKIGDSSTVGSISKIGMAFTGVKGAIDTAIAVVGKIKGKFDELTDAYKVQAQAEVQLKQAARNNPYLLPENVKALQNYAAEIQSFTTYGDEQLMPLMAQLASAGRTQEEIMNIMSASVNLAASGTMSLDSAVSTLNKTYSGSAGQLGQQISELRTLTEEELKQGKAVDLIAKKYDGMAAEVAKATGSSQQLKNAIGDLKEELGAPFEKALTPVRAFFTELVGGWASALSERRKYREDEQAILEGNAVAENYTSQIAQLESHLEQSRGELARRRQELLESYNRANEMTKWNLQALGEDGYNRIKSETDPSYREMLEKYSTTVDEYSAEFQAYLSRIENALYTSDINMETEYKNRLQEYKTEYEKLEQYRTEQNALRAQEQEAARQAAEDAANAEAAAVLQAEQDKRDKLREIYDETIRQKQAEIEQRKINGEEITAEAEAQELYNTAFSAYVKMMSDKAFEGNSGNFEHEVNARNDIAAWGNMFLDEQGKRELSEQMDEFLEELEKAAEEANGIVKNQYDILIEQLDKEYQAVIKNKYLEDEEKLRLETEYTNAVNAIRDAQHQEQLAREKEEKDAILEKLNAVTAGQQNYFDQYRAKLKELLDAQTEMEECGLFSTEEIEAKKTEIVEAQAQARKELAENIATDVANYTSQAVQIFQDASNLMLETVKNQYTAEQNELEIKYRKGEISEEEYNKKIAESKKKEAREEYKIKMWQWGASILQATANIAQGISKAIAQGGVAGLITGALVGAAGAVQIASIIASKPVPPSFSTGGIVGGSSYHGDNIAANLNSREMVMNMSQQKGLWDFINGGSNSPANGANIIVENSASNIVQAQPQIDKDQIVIAIDARVKDSLQKDRYGRELAMANQNAGGDYLGI